MNRKALLILAIAAVAATPAFADGFAKGTKLQTLSNLHPDMAKRRLYTMNYQLTGLIPVCSEIVVKDMGSKSFEFEYQGVEYTMEYEKHTKNAGVSFEDAVKLYFGPSCDQAKMKGLNQADKDGIASGSARIGMTKQGILIALGRPPHVSTPNLDANYWLYWRNRFGKMGVQFDDKGKVNEIK